MPIFKEVNGDIKRSQEPGKKRELQGTMIMYTKVKEKKVILI